MPLFLPSLLLAVVQLVGARVLATGAAKRETRYRCANESALGVAEGAPSASGRTHLTLVGGDFPMHRREQPLLSQRRRLCKESRSYMYHSRMYVQEVYFSGSVFRPPLHTRATSALQWSTLRLRLRRSARCACARRCVSGHATHHPSCAPSERVWTGGATRHAAGFQQQTCSQK